MPRVTHVKRAQQRYEMVPVLDENGVQKRVPMINARTGEQKVTKTGRPVTIGLTVRDYEKPLPMPTCDFCHETIQVGQSYKWIEPNGQRVRNRHADHPTWNVWEYSSSLSARIAQIQSDIVPEDFDNLEDAQTWASEKAQEIRDLAEEKRESAQNIENGFGHETEQSAELNEIADSLDEWADDLEGVDLPDYPEPEEEDCSTCGGTGLEQSQEEDADGNVLKEEIICPECEGTGQVTPEDPTDDHVNEWAAEVRDAIETVLNESPV